MDRLIAMEHFICVVEAGSFSAAARRLGIGQPAISKPVSRLEEYLAAKLLVRSTRRFTPTEFGYQFYFRAKRVIDEVNEVTLIAEGANVGFTGRLRVLAAVTFSRLHILPKLAHFLDRYPNLGVDVLMDDQNIDLIEYGIDVALRMGDLSDSSMTASKISQTRMLVLATPEYLLKYGTPQNPNNSIS